MISPSFYRDYHRIKVYLRQHQPVDDELCSLVRALEDKRFPTHCGVDFLAIARASAYNLIGVRGGGSTLTMQFVRTITHRRERTVRRKFREMMLAVIISAKFDKTLIFAGYLRGAYCGYRLRGTESAALALFNKSMHSCTRQEKAEIAALLRYPQPKIVSALWTKRVHARAQLALSRLCRIEASAEGRAGEWHLDSSLNHCH